jgi:hypothetical protein
MSVPDKNLKFVATVTLTKTLDPGYLYENIEGTQRDPKYNVRNTVFLQIALTSPSINQENSW